MFNEFAFTHQHIVYKTSRKCIEGNCPCRRGNPIYREEGTIRRGRLRMIRHRCRSYNWGGSWNKCYRHQHTSYRYTSHNGWVYPHNPRSCCCIGCMFLRRHRSQMYIVHKCSRLSTRMLDIGCWDTPCTHFTSHPGCTPSSIGNICLYWYHSTRNCRYTKIHNVNRYLLAHVINKVEWIPTISAIVYWITRFTPIPTMCTTSLVLVVLFDAGITSKLLIIFCSTSITPIRAQLALFNYERIKYYLCPGSILMNKFHIQLSRHISDIHLCKPHNSLLCRVCSQQSIRGSLEYFLVIDIYRKISVIYKWSDTGHRTQVDVVVLYR